MIRKIKNSDTEQGEVPSVIEHIQPKQCCIHPHEGCTPTKEFQDYENKLNNKKSFWIEKLNKLQKL